MPRLACALPAAVLLAVAPVPSARADEAAVESLMKKSNCMKCHAVDKKKDGPAFKQIAAKYKGKADAEATLVKAVTTGPKVKIDGVEETHDSLKTKNDAEVREVVKWILAR
ncbi:Cytochrome c-551 [Burkholderiales bacterium]|nr:Cytochrome c-551 [Burkholderiales bacterium]